jgi:hypothetical protein
MKQFIKITGILLVVLIGMSSCESNKSVQQYLLEKQSSSDFVSITLPASLLNIALDSLGSEEREAVNSLKKNIEEKLRRVNDIK